MTSPVGAIMLVVVLLAGGASTVLLRLSILSGGAGGARFYRALFQTVFIGLSVGAVVAVSGVPTMGSGLGFAALNGVFGGVAFILFTAGLENVEASTAKPALVVSMLVAVALGIFFLGESLTARKIAGVGFAMVAVYLLAGG
jgi:drug/metabolite transporter (DMT)-like permease